MRHLYTALLCLFMLNTLWGQQPAHPDFKTTLHDNNWITLRDNVDVLPEAFFDRYKNALGFDNQHDLVIYKAMEDNIGMVHYRAKQYVNGYPVDGAEFIFHTINDRVSHANGRLVKGNLPAANAQISDEEAIQLAMEYLDAPHYFWQMPGMEALVKRIKKDPEATFYPSPQLVWVDPKYSQQAENYQLAWKMEIYASMPVGTKEVFVNAQTGALVHTLEKCQHTNVPGIAETRYHGTQEFITDSVAPNLFRLRDYTRGEGVETFDMNESTDFEDGVDFEDEDNYWDNANDQFNDAATDVHWGSQKTYDYFLGKHGYESYDGNGSLMISYVHYGQGFFNAFWNGMWTTYGDGNGNPLTSIDVVSHEWTHGVTDYTSDLIYQDESGALNESFSDIFGNVVEFYALDTIKNWIIGEANFQLRNMANPKSYGDPDTYRGNNWFTGSAGNGGVHTNSGVQNYWFHLMTEGGSGTNDNGDDYEVGGLGLEKAAQIAFHNQVFYLTPSSQYIDARVGALRSAEDIFGSCSPEVVETAKAWHAVGIGSSTVTKDLSVVLASEPINGCADGSLDELTFTFTLVPSGCSFSLEAGDEITVGYRVNDGAPVSDNIVLNNTLNEEQEITHTFSTPADLNDQGKFEIDFWVSYGDDANSINDTLFDYEVVRPKVINEERTITFELKNNSISLDSFYMIEGDRAEIDLETTLDASEGLRMLYMTGGEIDGPDDIQFATTPEEVFTLNPEFNSRMCACVDLPQWDQAYFSFDLQQFWSKVFPEDFGVSNPQLITGMRVLINGEQIGSSFHPAPDAHTANSVPWETHVFDITDYAGTAFEICLQGKHFFNNDSDYLDNSFGDQTNIDEVSIYSVIPSNTEVLNKEAISLVPNPSNGQFFLNLPNSFSQSLEIEVSDALGRIVKTWSFDQQQVIPQLALQLPEVAPGLYLVTIETEGVKVTEKLIIE